MVILSTAAAAVAAAAAAAPAQSFNDIFSHIYRSTVMHRSVPSAPCRQNARLLMACSMHPDQSDI
jgi:hypothetical protein